MTNSIASSVFREKKKKANKKQQMEGTGGTQLFVKTKQHIL